MYLFVIVIFCFYVYMYRVHIHAFLVWQLTVLSVLFNKVSSAGCFCWVVHTQKKATCTHLLELLLYCCLLLLCVYHVPLCSTSTSTSVYTCTSTSTSTPSRATLRTHNLTCTRAFETLNSIFVSHTYMSMHTSPHPTHSYDAKYLPISAVRFSECNLSAALAPNIRKSACLLVSDTNSTPWCLKSNNNICKSKCIVPDVCVFNSRRSMSE